MDSDCWSLIGKSIPITDLLILPTVNPMIDQEDDKMILPLLKWKIRSNTWIVAR